MAAILLTALVITAFWALYPVARGSVMKAEGDGGSGGGADGGWDFSNDDLPF